jgi:alpha-ketoglutarate-dependent taurine dioxygenase
MDLPIAGRITVAPAGAALDAGEEGLNLMKPLDESENLLNRLGAHANKPEFAWYRQWKAGDLIVWDNRCAMHRRDAFDPNARRLMHRTQIEGDRPFSIPHRLRRRLTRRLVPRY